MPFAMTSHQLHFSNNYFSCKLRWEKYDAKGGTEKGAHKYGRLNEQSWWEKWGEHYDGRGSVLKWFLPLILMNDLYHVCCTYGMFQKF